MHYQKQLNYIYDKFYQQLGLHLSTHFAVKKMQRSVSPELLSGITRHVSLQPLKCICLFKCKVR